MPLVSIILLTYNHAQYIEDNILGLLEQDYSNVELIILDDASRDRTVEIIKCYHKELIEKFKRVEFFENKTNSGNIPYNINCMLKKTYGKYCKLISGDDIMASNCISKLVKSLMDNPQCSVAYSNQYIVEDNYKKGDSVKRSNKFYLHRKSEIEDEDMFRKLMFENSIVAPSSIIKRDVFEKIGLYDESIPYEDYEFWIRYAFYNGKFYYINECLIYYRRSDTSLTYFSSKDSKRKIMISMFAVGKTLKKYLHHLSPEDQLKCIKLYYGNYFKICKDAKFWRGIFSILYQMKRKNIK